MSHEDLGRHQELQIGSNRSFGLTIGGIIVVIGLIRTFLLGEFSLIEIGIFTAGTVLVLLAFFAEKSLTKANRAWMRLGLLLSKLVSPVVMGLIFYTAVTPTGLLMRLFRKDLLHLKKDSSTESYWIKREPPGPEPESIKHQF